MIKVLITGSAGYIGSHLTLLLIENGYHVIGIDNLMNSHPPRKTSGLDFYKGDIADEILINTIHEKHPEIEMCIHLAGSIYIDESYAMPERYYDNNVVKNRLFLDQISQTGITKIIYSSSASVYGNAALNPINETAPLKPEHPYGQTKLEAEKDIQAASQKNGLSYIILRYFNVAGADEKMRAGQHNKRSTHLIKAACEVLTGQKKTLTINGNDYSTPDGTCIRDYIHVSDLANIHLLALQHLENNGKSNIMNCGYGVGYSVNEICAATQKISHNPIKVAYGSRRKGDVATLVADPQKLTNLLNWKPRYNDLMLIIKSALKWEHKRLALESIKDNKNL